MNDDAIQGVLFGGTEVDANTDEAGPVDELRLCALNVNSPNPGRAQRIVNWLLATKSNALVLTEMQPADGSRTRRAGRTLGTSPPSPPAASRPPRYSQRHSTLASPPSI